MFRHEKQYLNPVRIDRPNPNYAALLQEQVGGAQSELTSALQYFAQSARIKDPEIKDLFLDITAEELSHLEMVSACVNMLNGHDPDVENAKLGSVEAHLLSGLAPMYANASGYLWTPAYLNVTGDLAADILTDIAGEQRAKVVYQNLYRQIKDKGVRETIDFLLNREEAHGTMLREAFNRIQDTGSQKDWGTTADARIYFDLSHPGGQSFDPTRKNPSKFPN